MIQSSKADLTPLRHYDVGKTEVQSGHSWVELMEFIVSNRPLVVYQFWITVGTDGAPDSHKMLYSRMIPEPAGSSEV